MQVFREAAEALYASDLAEETLGIFVPANGPRVEGVPVIRERMESLSGLSGADDAKRQIVLCIRKACLDRKPQVNDGIEIGSCFYRVMDVKEDGERTQWELPVRKVKE